jgi:ribosomal protein L11 methylase PrmA
MTKIELIPGSFRDPSGFLFLHEDTVYRQVNRVYQSDYDRLIESGLYDRLTKEGLLIPHEEDADAPRQGDDVYKVIRPERLDFVAYPYEWCFGQLKDAALTTLRIAELALEHDMLLKDATAYNIQFHRGRPVLIDTLSFEAYREGEPWVAYRQFCQHFLAPLALVAYTDVRLGQLLRVFMDGLPLDLTSKLLPFRTRLRFPLLTHLHLLGAVERRASSATPEAQAKGQGRARSRVSRQGLQGILSSLRSGVERLDWAAGRTVWSDYYTETNYSDEASINKQGLVEQFLGKLSPSTVWDLGANTGVFSRIAARTSHLTVSFDLDPAAVEKNYHQCKAEDAKNILPLVLDLTNPSPGIGWENRERPPVFERGKPDAVLALALIHHLAIGNNLPLARIASFFHSLASPLIIEFVPKADSQVKRMLASRVDIFDDYDQAGFERAFEPLFTLRESVGIPETERTLYRMEPRDA